MSGKFFSGNVESDNVSNCFGATQFSVLTDDQINMVGGAGWEPDGSTTPEPTPTPTPTPDPNGGG